MTTREPIPGVDRPITKEDLEARLRNVRDEVGKVKESTLGAGIAAGGAALVLLVILAFLIGRRRGKKKYAFVEIRRV